MDYHGSSFFLIKFVTKNHGFLEKNIRLIPPVILYHGSWFFFIIYYYDIYHGSIILIKMQVKITIQNDINQECKTNQINFKHEQKVVYKIKTSSITPTNSIQKISKSILFIKINFINHKTKNSRILSSC